MPLQVVKRDGTRQPFDRSKVVAGVRIAAKDRPVTDDDLEALAGEVEEELRMIRLAEEEAPGIE